LKTNVQLAQTEAWEIYSQIMDYTYEIKVYVPDEEPPEKGFPVYYLLDGNDYFQFGRDIVMLQSRNTQKTAISPAIVIGIGHKHLEERVKMRFYDFTPPAPQYVYPDRIKEKNLNLGKHGGAEKFLTFLESELLPIISKTYHIDREKQALFGHSLGGLFVLWTLFTRQELFQVYLASSPSTWWNDYEIRKYAEKFYEKKINVDRKLFVSVGSEEMFMVEDAKQIVSSLNAHNIKKLHKSIYVAQDENHASVVPTIMSRAFRFATF